MHRKKLKKNDDNKWINQYNKKDGGGLSKERVNIDYGISY